ncbi:hypothetical protein ACWEQL_41095 [Kitasatospora sp. NPDC004240]
MDEAQSGDESTRTATQGTGRAARAAREWLGWIVLAAGAVLCVLGWYGISGERYVEQQLPFLASATVPGAALIVAGAVLAAPLRAPGRREELTDHRVARLYALLVEPEPGAPRAGAPPPPPAGGPLAVPAGTVYHRPGCALIAGRPAAAPVDAAAVRERGLTPCRLCDPPEPGAGPPGEPAPGPPGPSPGLTGPAPEPGG